MPGQLGATTPYAQPVGGSTQDSDLLGNGQFQVAPIQVDSNQFNNAVGAQSGQQLGAEFNNYLGNTTQPVVATQAAGGPQGNYNTGTAGQLGLAQQYQTMAAGGGPSLATQTAQQQGQANIAATESMLGSARGSGDPAAAQLAARNAQTAGAQQVAQNAVMGRTNEELGAMNSAAGLYGNVAGQGLTSQQLGQQNNQFNAGQVNQIAQGNQSNTLAANTNYMSALGQQNVAQQQGQIQGQQLNAQTQLGQQQLQEQAYQQAAANKQKTAGGAMQGIMGLAGTVASFM